jgi:hypothetical protein
VLQCEECGERSPNFVAGWSAFYVSDPEAADDPPTLVVYCSSCLAREFEGVLRWLSRAGLSRTPPRSG